MATPRKDPKDLKKRGRKSGYQEDYPRQAQALVKLGATDREVAAFFKVDEDTVRRWKHLHPKFCGALKVGKAPADERVEMSLFKRATGYSYEAVKIFQYEGAAVEVPYIEHVPPDTTACIFWLKNRMRDKWRDVRQAEVSAPGGKPIEVVQVPAGTELLRDYYARAVAASAAAGGDPDLGRDRQGRDVPPGDSDPGEG